MRYVETTRCYGLDYGLDMAGLVELWWIVAE